MMKGQGSRVKGQGRSIRVKRISVLIFIFMLSAFSFQFSAHCAEAVSSKDLIENAKSLDGKIVRYRGEIVGAILSHGRYSWINLNDGANAIGVWAPSKDLGGIVAVGDYTEKGDILEIEGLFQRACALHGGELDIHATKIKIVNSGYPVGEDIDRKKIRLSIFLYSALLFAIFIFRRRI